MDERVKRLKTPEECERFARNVSEKNPSLAHEAHRRRVELLASAHGAYNDVELEALKAVYAYEEILMMKHNGRRVRASYTWRMIGQHGIIETIERLVRTRKSQSGFVELAKMGMQDLTFEAVVLRNPKSFTQEALSRARQRLGEAPN